MKKEGHLDEKETARNVSSNLWKGLFFGQELLLPFFPLASIRVVNRFA